MKRRWFTLIGMVMILVVALQARSAGAVAAGGVSIVGQVEQGQQPVAAAQPAAGVVDTGRIASGYRHSCAIRLNGTLACWGNNYYKQATPPSGIFKQVAAGYSHSCGIKNDGTLACWGRNNYRQATPPSGTFLQIDAGDDHACGVREDNTLACWGRNTSGQATPPSGTFLQVSAGAGHSCGIKSDSTLACWGRNTSGQATPPSGAFLQVSGGWIHTCGVREDNVVACWGSGSYGVFNAIGDSAMQVASGARHNCTIRLDGSIRCYGEYYPPMGDSTWPGATFQQITSGDGFSCGIKSDGTLDCWGSTMDGAVQPPSGRFAPALRPTVNVPDLSIKEGNTGSTPASFAVSLSSPYTATVTVDYVVLDGSASAGSDYSPSEGTLTFPAGNIRQNVPVTVSGDTRDELDERFLLNLSEPTNATLARAEATGTIVDDDGPAVTIGDVTVVEGSSGERTIAVPVSLSAQSPQTIIVKFATANGTATAGQDYVAKNGSISFSPGIIHRLVFISIIGDTAIEDDETFTITLSQPRNATMSDRQSTVTIQDDDVPDLIVGNAIVQEGTGGTTTAEFRVRALASPKSTITVDYATSDGSATAGSDYTATSGTLTLLDGTTVQTVTVPITTDGVDELNESFTLTLSNPTNANLADAKAVGKLVDDDGPSISIDDALLLEGNNGVRYAYLSVALSGKSVQPVTVRYTTGGGTATAGSDYGRSSGKLTFSPGQLRKTVSVMVVGDTLDEADETFDVTLSAPTEATIADGSAMVTLLDDDPLPVRSADAFIQEGASGIRYAYFEVQLSQAHSSSVHVQMATVDGTAKAGTDYQRMSQTLTFEPGQTRRLVAVAVKGDTMVEPDEGFRLLLTPPSGVTMVDADMTALILNDD